MNIVESGIKYHSINQFTALTQQTECNDQSKIRLHVLCSLILYIMLGECNTILSAYTMYRHLEQYSTHPSICHPFKHLGQYSPTIFKSIRCLFLQDMSHLLKAHEKSSRWLWKESCVRTGVRKPENTCASPTAMI